MAKASDIFSITAEIVRGKEKTDSLVPLDSELSELWDLIAADVAASPETIWDIPSENPDIDTDDLAYMDEPATKSIGIESDELTLVSKAVPERMFTLGPMYIPNRMDAHAEWTDPDELQKAVWEYVRKGDRRIRLQHNRDVVAGEFVEVMAWPYPVEVPMVQKSGATTNMTFPANTVFLGVVWEPWAWELVKNDKLRGYSIGGRAERLLADLPEEYVGKAMAPFEDAIRIEAEDSPQQPIDIGQQIATAVAEAMKSISPTVNVVMPEDKPKIRRVERDDHGNILRIVEE